jgi:hypothetical protein
VLILNSFKSFKTEVLILRELRPPFAQVLIMRRLASDARNPEFRSPDFSFLAAGKSACARRGSAEEPSPARRSRRFVRKRRFCSAWQFAVLKIFVPRDTVFYARVEDMLELQSSASITPILP